MHLERAHPAFHTTLVVLVCIGWGGLGGDNNNIGDNKMVFGTKKYHFYVLFAWTATIAILHQIFGKVIKTTPNVPKTVDDH